MRPTKIKQKLYSLLPNFMKKKVKSIYYDGIIYPWYGLKYLVYYGETDFFDSIAIETTTYCNLRCKFCPNSKYERGLKKNKKTMDTNLFKKIINELSEINYRGQILFHFYGDPLTDKRIIDLVSYARKKLPKARLQINTNGFLLTIPLYKALLKAGIDSFLITRYETEPPAVKKLLEYLKRRARKENKIKYRTLGYDIGLSNRGGEIKVETSIDFDRPICIYPNNSLIVDYLGNIILCCNDYHSSIIFGNLKNEKLIDIWKNPAYKKMRQDLRKRIFTLPICKKCVGIE